MGRSLFGTFSAARKSTSKTSDFYGALGRGQKLASLFWYFFPPEKVPLAGGRAFQAAVFCLGQGFAKYGTYTIREQQVGNVFAKGGLAFLSPLARLLEPHCFRPVAPCPKNTEAVLPAPSLAAQLVARQQAGKST